MWGELRVELRGSDVYVYDGIHRKFHLFPLPASTAARWSSVAGLFITLERGNCWPLDRDGTRLRRVTDRHDEFLGYQPAGPVGEYGWLLDLAQEAGLVLPDPEEKRPAPQRAGPPPRTNPIGRG
jgi:hypothetical protein